MTQNISYDIVCTDVVITEGKFFITWLAYRNVDRLTLFPICKAIHIDACYFITFRVSVKYPGPR